VIAAIRGLSLLALGALVAACGQPAAPAGPPIAAVHQAQCGRCHAPPAPGSHTRDAFADAFSRHGKRVHLSTEEWQAMIDYLAPAEASAR